MKKIIAIITLSFSLLLIFSCQKEMSSEILQRGNGVDSNGIGLLNKKVSTYLVDNLDYYTQEFEYDSADRIWIVTNTLKVKQANGTITVTKGVFQFFRDGAGRIIRIGSSPDTSSINTFINYENAASNKVISTYILKTTGAGSTILDSIGLIYDAANRVIRTNDYNVTVVPAGQIKSYQLYQYDAIGNVTEKRNMFDMDNNGTFDINYIFSWQYDNKTNPSYHPEHSLFNWAYGWPTTISPNNVLKQINFPASIPNEELVYSFQYDSLGRPASMIKGFNTGGPNIFDLANITKYYYN